MTCPKCAAHMLLDVPLQFHASFVDMSETERSATYHCLLCGTYADPIIARNKAKQEAARLCVAA